MPPKPTCKVVKREGQRGARIDPKGCKVRTTKDTQGNKRQYNKRGEEKITIKTTGNEMRLVVAGARQHSTVRNWGNRTICHFLKPNSDVYIHYIAKTMR